MSILVERSIGKHCEKRLAQKEENMRTHALTISLVLLFLIPFALFAGGDKEEGQMAVSTGSRVVTVEDLWSFSWQFMTDEIEFTVKAPTTGWVGIGFNPSRMMKDAQYILGYIADGQLYVRDDFGTGNTTHAPDGSVGGDQHVRAISGKEEGGATTITFALPLKAQDPYDIDFVQGETYKVLLAYGANNADNYTGKHQSRTSVDVLLD